MISAKFLGGEAVYETRAFRDVAHVPIVAVGGERDPVPSDVPLALGLMVREPVAPADRGRKPVAEPLASGQRRGRGLRRDRAQTKSDADRAAMGVPLRMVHGVVTRVIADPREIGGAGDRSPQVERVQDAPVPRVLLQMRRVDRDVSGTAEERRPRRG